MDVFDAVVRDHRQDLCAGILRAAHGLGLMRCLEHEPRSSAQLADLLQLSPSRLPALLDLLVLEGALSRSPGQRWRLNQPVPQPPPLRGELFAAQIETLLRSDSPLPDGDWPLTPEGLRRYHAHLFQVGGTPAHELIALLRAHPDATLLDMGGGAGRYCQAFLEPRRNGRATLFDRSEVVTLARERLAKFEGRVSFVEGDLFELSLAGVTFDVVLLANVLHLYSPVRCRQLISRAVKLVSPGGQLVIKDLWISPDRSGPAGSLYFALNMAMYTDGGNVYDPERIRRWVNEAGLRDTTISRLPGGGLALQAHVSSSLPNQNR